MIKELRMLIADRLLGWAVVVAPYNHPASVSLWRAALDHSRRTLDSKEMADLRERRPEWFTPD